nr:UDP-N-acetylmuramate dehydrogenase [Paenibacillus phyllosphaerae]
MNVMEAFLRTIYDESHIKINEPLRNYAYTKIGGSADVLVFPVNEEQVQQTLQYADLHEIPVTILGNASNVLIRDGGIRGIVMNLTLMNGIERQGNKVIAKGGASLIETSRFALSHTLSGLEFACGIPGTVGGAVYMNAGAYGGEVSDVIDHAVVLTVAGERRILSKDELGLEYRNSAVAKQNLIVLEATFTLRPGVREEMEAKMNELTFLRESKQPLEYPSCGSVFKRPPNLFAGKLIQDAGLQGVRIGGAQVSTKHAGFIVNVGESTSDDYLSVIRLVQQKVKEAFDVELQMEVKVIGEDE